MGLFDTSSNSEDKKRQLTVNGGDETNAVIVDASGRNTSLNITDGGAIAGNTAIANNALKTAETITRDVGERFAAQQSGALSTVEKITSGFGSALESIKKAELTGGGSLLFDNLKYWPIIPVAIIVVVGIKSISKGKK